MAGPNAIAGRCWPVRTCRTRGRHAARRSGHRDHARPAAPADQEREPRARAGLVAVGGRTPQSRDARPDRLRRRQRAVGRARDRGHDPLQRGPRAALPPAGGRRAPRGPARARGPRRARGRRAGHAAGHRPAEHAGHDRRRARPPDARRADRGRVSGARARRPLRRVVPRAGELRAPRGGGRRSRPSGCRSSARSPTPRRSTPPAAASTRAYAVSREAPRSPGGSSTCSPSAAKGSTSSRPHEASACRAAPSPAVSARAARRIASWSTRAASSAPTRCFANGISTSPRWRMRSATAIPRTSGARAGAGSARRRASTAGA